MKYNVKLVKIILSLNKEQYSKFNEFLIDVDKVFCNNLENFNKVMNQFADGKRQFLNRNVNKFINEYRSLLEIFEYQNVLIDLTKSISQAYSIFLKFIQYVNKNIAFKDNMIKCIQGFENSGINVFEFNPNMPFAIECSETKDGDYHKVMGAFSDGENLFEFIKQVGFTKYYLMDLAGANYVIHYIKDNMDGLKKLDVIVKNLEFNPETLPDYFKLHGKNSWQNIAGGKVKKIIM